MHYKCIAIFVSMCYNKKKFLGEIKMSSKVNKYLGRDEHVICEAKISVAVLIIHVLLIFVAIGLITIWKPLIDRFTTVLCFTNKKVIGKTGLVKTKSLEAPLNKINNASVDQGFFGKILGYGTVRIDTSSGTYIFSHISKPDKFKTALMNQIEKYDDERIQKQAQAIAGSFVQQ